jgi:hypothetical protein
VCTLYDNFPNYPLQLGLLFSTSQHQIQNILVKTSACSREQGGKSYLRYEVQDLLNVAFNTEGVDHGVCLITISFLHGLFSVDYVGDSSWIITIDMESS